MSELTQHEQIVQAFNQYLAEAETFDEKGVKVIIDPKFLVYLKGTELDYVKEGLNEGFKFINPNEKARCGCGESFSV